MFYSSVLRCMMCDATHVVVWIASTIEHAKAIAYRIDRKSVLKGVIYRHQKWYNESDYTKDVRKVSIIIVDCTFNCMSTVGAW